MNNQLEAFVNLGKASKTLAKYDHHKKLVIRLKIGMARIVKDLKPVEGMVLELNPKYTDLFDALTLFYEQYLSKSEETPYENIDKIVEAEYNQKG